ncbi:efflux RND transporter periplasmic adaptor subunit [Candidatus Reidiella endopervernicosa]|nr:efflux RND transporter periplasmic adaptor subunit [Candidatus Reidiella endopervernicosa]QKQ27452.1 efflux RND transporter periplasmic adaptor subunit [Candidatus Reidiella endopervernicosa]
MVLCLSAFSSLHAATVDLQRIMVDKVPVEDVRLLDGLVEAVNRSTVSSQASGRIESIYFDIDDYVKRGDVLLKIRDTTQRAAMNSAEAVFQETQARLDGAHSEYDRTKEIYAKKLVAKSKLDQAEAAFKSATARRGAAKAGVEEAQEALAQTTVKAPYSGIVTERHVEIGEMASIGTHLMSGLSLEALRITVEVPQSLMPTVRSGAKMQGVLPDGRLLESKHVTLFPIANSTSHAFKMRLALPEGQHDLYPGMFIKVSVSVGSSEKIVIPLESVAYRSEVTGVYVVDTNGRVSLRHIRLGQRQSEARVEVLSGLRSGESIALDPVRAGVVLKQQGRDGK